MQRTEPPENILDFLARRRRPAAHARGGAATALLLDYLCGLQPRRVLEIGFGTGHTLIEMTTRLPGAAFFGIEKSPPMLDAAQRRLRFCGIRGISLALLPPDGSLPFPDGHFDAVVAESVLAIQAKKEQTEKSFAEIFRVLRPGGFFLNNESLWLEHVSPRQIRDINAQCRAAFGIIQATAERPYPADWQALAAETGFDCCHFVRLHGRHIFRKKPWRPALWRSSLFSLWGKAAEFFPGPARRQSLAYRANMRRMTRHGNFLEGVLFGFRKPG